MRIERVSYTRLFPTGSFANEKIGVELIVNEGEDAKAALETAKQLVNEFHFENNKELYEQRGTIVTDVHDPEFIKKDMDIIIRGIYNNAVKNNDYDTIDKIKLEYNVEPK